MTALVSLSAGGAITGFSFVPQAAADFSSPASMPLNLVALRQSVQGAGPDRSAPGHDAMLRAAIVHVARHYLRMAGTRTPAEMEAIIWQHDSIDSADHGQSCAAFASLTLELGAQVAGGQSWVSGGGSYPWPLHSWADVRVEPNPSSLAIISIQQDAQAHDRWHPLGDGYAPLPGDWVLFDGHVEVVTKDAGGVLHTIGGDSLPNFSVNAHEYPGPLSGAGVVGFVNNGSLPDAGPAAGATGAAGETAGAQAAGARTEGATSAGGTSAGARATQKHADAGPRSSLAAIPGTETVPAAGAAARASTDPAIPGLVPAQRTSPAAPAHQAERAARAARDDRHARGAREARSAQPARGRQNDGEARSTQEAANAQEKVSPGGAAIPGVTTGARTRGRGSAYRRHHPAPARKPVAETQAQQAFISAVAPGAIEAQHRYGVPAAVTIAQAIDESGWGQSELAARDHNLFGIKGAGPAGSVPLPTEEYVNGQAVSTSASFRVYHNVAESIDDHGRLLASSGYYQQAMSDRTDPDKFAAALTGVYATDPNYGANLISLMRRYDLYPYGVSGQGQPGRGQPGRGSGGAEPGSATIPGVPGAPEAPAQPAGSASPRPAPASPRPAHAAPKHPASPEPSTAAPTGPASPQPSTAAPTGLASPQPGSTAPTAPASPEPTSTGSSVPAPTASPRPTSSAGPHPAPTASPRPTSSATPHPPSTASLRPASSPGSRPAPAASPATTSSASRRPIPMGSAGPVPSAAVRPSVPAHPGTASPAPPPPASAQPSIPGISTQSESAHRQTTAQARRTGQPLRATLVSTRRYQSQIPRPALNAFVETAKAPLLAGQTTYQEVAGRRGISWQLLAACDWMQCEARTRRSPVYGERLGAVNGDGTVYVQRSAALGRCADDLVRLSRTVYGLDLTRDDLSVADLANAFAAFRWGGLLKAHDCSAMEFPYSVAGLTDRHVRMRWPRITDPGNGDRPGARFHRRFGALPIVLSLDYPATV
jgi:flagellum-specific peptidoglycan hydrolase FlgJ